MISTMQGIHEPFKDGNMRRHFGVLAFAASLVFAGVSQAEFSAGGDDNEAVVVRQAEPAVTDGVASEIPTDRFRVEPSGTDETSGSITVHSEPSAAVQSKAPIL